MYLKDLKTISNDLELVAGKTTGVIKTIEGLKDLFSTIYNKIPQVWELDHIIKILAALEIFSKKVAAEDIEITTHARKAKNPLIVDFKGQTVTDLIDKSKLLESRYHQDIIKIENYVKAINNSTKYTSEQKEWLAPHFRDLVTILTKMEWCMYHALNQIPIDITNAKRHTNSSYIELIHFFRQPVARFPGSTNRLVETEIAARRIKELAIAAGIWSICEFEIRGRTITGSQYPTSFFLQKKNKVIPAIIVKATGTYPDNTWNFYYQLGEDLGELGLARGKSFIGVLKKHAKAKRHPKTKQKFLVKRSL